MKKLGLLLVALGLGACIGLGSVKNAPVMVRAEDETTVTEPEDLSATVTLPKLQHGTVEATILEGVEGDICKLNVKAELLYLIGGVSVNGVALIEDENISGLYSFALVRGENLVAVKIVVNEELLGDLSVIYDEVRNKDWTNLFTVENLLILIKWVFDCGILIALIRYYVRDKRLASKLEKATKEELNKIIPQATRDTVVATVKDVLEPLFAQLKADNLEIVKGMSVFAKIMALMQEDTPESRVAILDLLSQLNLSDEKTLAEVKAYIDKLFADHINSYNEVMDKLNAISEENKQLAEVEEEPKIDVGDGTTI